ncbi:MAG: tetratricopeptide repeat protein [Bacteroidota bacterium]
MKRTVLNFVCALSVLSILLVSACGSDQPQQETQEIAPTGDPEIDQVSQRIAGDPESADLYALRAEIFYDKNSYDQAISDMTVALSIDSINLDYHHLLTDIYLDYFRSRLALQTMERAVALVPDDIPSLLKLSEIQLFLKMNQASLTSIDKVLRIDPQNALAYFFMGKNFEELGDVNRAINAYQESSEIDPEMLDTWIKLGQLHASINGNLAETFFDNAIEVDSNSTIALQAKAEYLWDQNKPEEALQVYRQAVIRNPMDEKSAYNTGLVYLELDSAAQAYQHFSMAIENAPLYAAAYYYRGYASEVMGNAEQAKTDYQHTLRLAPNYEQAQEGLARVQ